jgi:alpha 1,3-glucosidase
MVGDALLVKPVTDAGKTNLDIYLPLKTVDGKKKVWYDFHSMVKIDSATGTGTGLVNVNAPLDRIPVFIRGGKIIPRKFRLRRSSKLMFYDPYTLVIAPDAEGNAAGVLYMDDEYSVAHQTNPSESVLRQFNLVAPAAKLTCRAKFPSESGATILYEAPNLLERILIAGQQRAPVKILVVTKKDGKETELQFFYDANSKILSIKKPDVYMTEDWDIHFLY